MTLTVILAALAFCGICYRQSVLRSADYERIINILTTDRDAARSECVTLRGLLIPRMAPKAEATEKKPVPKVQPKLDRTIPFRKLFKSLVAQNNTRQIQSDTLVEAVAKGQANG